MKIYPNGNRADLMCEVDDELGYRGRVNSTLFGLAPEGDDHYARGARTVRTS